MTKCFIYGLFEPTSGELRYVGKTIGRLSSRLSKHLYSSRLKNKNRSWTDTSHRGNWIRALKSSPEIEVIEIVDKTEATEAEFFWIEYFKSIGCSLTNSHTSSKDESRSYGYRRSVVPDSEIINMYLSGKSSGRIAKQLKTCKKRVLRVVEQSGLVKGKSAKSIEDSCGNSFSSISLAAQANSCSVGNISNALVGKAKTACGKTWRYL